MPSGAKLETGHAPRLRCGLKCGQKRVQTLTGATGGRAGRGITTEAPENACKGMKIVELCALSVVRGGYCCRKMGCTLLFGGLEPIAPAPRRQSHGASA